MRRRIVVITVFLLLGAIVNVTVAWGARFVIREDPQTINVSPLRMSTTLHTVVVESRVQQVGRMSAYKTGDAFVIHRVRTTLDEYILRSSFKSMTVGIPLLPHRDFAKSLRGDSPFHPVINEQDHLTVSDENIRAEYAAGWPRCSLRFIDRLIHDQAPEIPYDDSVPSVIVYGLELPRIVAEHRSTLPLPLLPIWPGFIINTLFYALILWMLFFTPFTARRMIRRRRGLCEQCAYPIGVSPVCTECGAAVSPSDSGRAA